MPSSLGDARPRKEETEQDKAALLGDIKECCRQNGISGLEPNSGCLEAMLQSRNRVPTGQQRLASVAVSCVMEPVLRDS